MATPTSSSSSSSAAQFGNALESLLNKRKMRRAEPKKKAESKKLIR
jgi:hypothetical protein